MNNNQITSIEAGDIVRENYFMYGKYINLEGRTVCDCRDSLKLVQRRILYSAYTIFKSAGNKTIKTATVVGETIGKYHPHGDTSVADAISGMVLDGVMTGKGNFGSTVGLDNIEAAAMRYTECRLSDKINKMCFKYINDVPYVVNDLGFEEPAYIPTPLPINLLHLSDSETWVSAIGLGLAYTLPKFDVGDLYKLLKSIVMKKKITNNVRMRYRTMIIPTSDEIFNTGKGTVTSVCSYKVSDDKKSITINEFSPTKKSPRNIIKKFDGIPVDLSKINTEVEINLSRGKSTDDYDIDKMLTCDQKVDMMFHTENKIKYYSLPEIVETTYNYYKAAVNNHLNKRLTEVSQKISLIKLMILVKPHLNPLNEKTAERVSKKVKVDVKEIEALLSKYTVNQFCNAENKLKDLEDTKKELEYNLSNLDDFCINEIGESI